MTHLSGRRLGRVLTGLAAVLTATALAGSATASAVTDTSASGPAAAPGAPATTAAPDGERTAPAPTAKRSSAPLLPVWAATRNGNLYWYWPNGRGLGERDLFESGWTGINAATQVDLHNDGSSTGLYMRYTDGVLVYKVSTGSPREIGGGWGKYNVLLSPGDLSGSKQSDLLTRDTSGVLWLHLAKSDGSFSSRTKVGPGWGQYTQLAGQHDLSGDGRADIVARDGSGVLWLYRGNGDAAKPFAKRSKIGSGWNAYNHLVSTGDVDGDGRSDLLARDKTGALWLYKGTGKTSAPFKAKTKIGNAGWNQYVQIF